MNDRPSLDRIDRAAQPISDASLPRPGQARPTEIGGVDRGMLARGARAAKAIGHVDRQF